MLQLFDQVSVFALWVMTGTREGIRSDLMCIGDEEMKDECGFDMLDHYYQCLFVPSSDDCRELLETCCPRLYFLETGA